MRILVWSSLLFGVVVAVNASCASSDESISVEIDETQDSVSLDVYGVGQELTAFQKELRLGKRKFQQLWKNLKERHNHEAMIFNHTIQAIRDETRRIHDSFTRNLRSLNNFMACLNSCLRSHEEDGDSVSEGRIQYFCNHSCMLMLEQSHRNTGSEDMTTTSKIASLVG